MIDEQHKEDINITNGPFCLFGKMFPEYNDSVSPLSGAYRCAFAVVSNTEFTLRAKKAVNGEIYSRQRLFCYSFFEFRL